MDPDNRRPVDWETRAARLDEVRRACDVRADGAGVPPLDVLRGWLANAENGTLKMYLTTRLLRLRRDDGPALALGRYRPMTAEGKHAERLVAFQRGEGPEARIVVVPRLSGGLGPGAPIGARWDDTRVRIENEGVGGWRCLLSGVDVPARDGFVAASTVLAELPVAVLAPTKSA